MCKQVCLEMKLEQAFQLLLQRRVAVRGEFAKNPTEAIRECFNWIEIRGILSHQDVVSLMDEYDFKGKSMREIMENKSDVKRLHQLIDQLVAWRKKEEEK